MISKSKKILILILFFGACTVVEEPTPSSALVSLIAGHAGTYNSQQVDRIFVITSDATQLVNESGDIFSYVKGSNDCAIYEGILGGDKMKFTLSDIDIRGGFLTLYNLQSLIMQESVAFTWKYYYDLEKIIGGKTVTFTLDHIEYSFSIDNGDLQITFDKIKYFDYTKVSDNFIEYEVSLNGESTTISLFDIDNEGGTLKIFDEEISVTWIE